MGQSLWIRLSAPVTTYQARPGDPVQAVLTHDLVCDNEVVLPMGARIEGIVRSRHKVGLGIRHETATLDLDFNRAFVGPGIGIDITTQVEEVENAREIVRKGVIRGIRSSDTFQGRINSRLIHLPTWNPYSDPVLIAYKALFPIFPEPEIYYPAGTDIRLRTTGEITSLQPIASASRESAAAAKPDSGEMDELVDELPVRVTTQKNKDADLLNIIFLGTQDEVTESFRQAGWDGADPLSRRAVLRDFYALLNNSGYAHEPMMTFYLNGRAEDMNWQKSLNSYGRRDHLRIWQWSSGKPDQSVWISSSTHDVSAALSVRHRGFEHHIASDIDEERSTVIRDLDFAGCIKSVNYIARPEMPMTSHNAAGDVMHTDGSVAIITLQACQSSEPQPSSGVRQASFKPGNYAYRFLRRQILTFRSDMLRANIIYSLYDCGRVAVMTMRHQPVTP